MSDGDAPIVGRTISLDLESTERLARLCAAVGCSAEQVIQDALLTLEGLLEQGKTEPHTWTEEDDAAMRRSIADFERGEGIAHEQVMAEARAIAGG